MIPVDINSWNEDVWQEFGTLLVEFDESEAYEENETRLFKNGKKYTLISANGCSCWSGEWDGWTNITKTELRKLGIAWSKDWGKAEQAIGKWIKENI